MKVSRRVVVGTLGGCAASLAFLVGAVSLTRIAGDYLGFPRELKWTLTGAVDVAGIAGGIMWTAFAGDVRRIGRPMNIVCTVISGVGVGLDHATHAFPDPVWQWVAFGTGLFIPALAAWILHSLAVIADVVEAPATPDHQAGDHQVGDRLTAGDRQAPIATRAVITKVGDRQATTIIARPTSPGDRQAALPAGDQGGDRQASDRQAGGAEQPALPPARRPDRSPAPAAARPARALASVPEPRLAWMTDHLIATVVDARRADGSYGRGQVVRDHGLSPAKARSLIEYIDRHDLTRASA